MLCPHCADLPNAAMARRLRVLQLLALVEHPDALPPDAALRIAGELLCWAADDAPPIRSAGAVNAEPEPALEA